MAAKDVPNKGSVPQEANSEASRNVYNEASNPTMDKSAPTSSAKKDPATNTESEVNTEAMSEKPEQRSPFSPDVEAAAGGAPPALPRGWMYKSPRIGPVTLPWYASPRVQLFLIAMVCFLCPGIFNSLSALGGAGISDPTIANNANTALYATFSIVGFFAGSIVNRLGIKLTLSFGGLGYCIYVISFLVYNHVENAGFTIFAGFLLGVCASLLWSAQGCIMMSYPSEKVKGRYISWFWMIFNMGAVIGSLASLGLNINNTGGSVTDGTYIAFIVLTFLGAVLAWSLVDAKHVVRKDGSRIILMKHPTWQSEIVGLFEVLAHDWYIILFFPMFFASNFFYPYQFNSVNLGRFTTRTRGLNGVLYWVSQIIGAYVFGFALDFNRISRPSRARIALLILFVLVMAIWGGGYAFQITYVRDLDPDKDAVEARKMDWTSPGYIGPMFLYMFYGFFDAAWQTSVYWFMGSLTNNSRKLANFAGFYKGIQSAGGAAAASIDSKLPPYMSEFATNWGLLAGSLIFAAPVIFLKISESVPIEEDLKFSDETIEDVAVPAGDSAEGAKE